MRGFQLKYALKVTGWLVFPKSRKVDEWIPFHFLCSFSSFGSRLPTLCSWGQADENRWRSYRREVEGVSCSDGARVKATSAAGFTQKLPPTELVPGRARPLLHARGPHRTHNRSPGGCYLAAHCDPGHEAAAQKGPVACPSYGRAASSESWLPEFWRCGYVLTP